MNGDGKADMISGSWSGEITLFAASGSGFAKGIPLLGSAGKKLVPGSATAVAVTDWDRDGDLDLLVGVISGNVSFFPNVGTKTRPKFGSEQPLRGGGKPITANDGGPCVADWDGDGTEDLILGDGEGNVRWFRAKRGSSGVPTLEAGEFLIRSQPTSSEASEKGPLYRTKPTVADWNRDGKPDLLVGDFWTRTIHPPQSDEKKPEQAQVRKKLAEAQMRLNERVQAADKAARKSMGIAPNMAISGDRRKAYDAAYIKALTSDPGYRKTIKEMSDLRRKMPQPKYVYGGYVWVYLRR
ncbi:MAG: FG-GAP repeat domain-containing protein [Fimbriimonas sp.]